MKKITAIFISVIISVSCMFPIHVNAETDQYTWESLHIFDSDPDESKETVEDSDSEEEWTVEYYEIVEADFDKLIEDPSPDNINEICNETNKIVKTQDDSYISVCYNWALSKDHMEYLANDVFMSDTLRSLIGSNTEIYDYRYITTYLDPMFEAPFIIWVNTSVGVRLVAFEPAEEGESKNFIDYYYAETYTADEFRDKFSSRSGKVYYNGVELKNGKSEIRYKAALINLREVMEAADIDVIDCEDGSMILKPLNDIDDVRSAGFKISYEYYEYEHYYGYALKLVGAWEGGADISDYLSMMSNGIRCYFDEDGEVMVTELELINLLRLTSYVGNFYNFEVNVSQEDNAVYIKNMEDISVYLNGSELILDKKALRENEQTIVPMRDICEALKTVVGWDGSAATIEKNGTTLALTIGSDVMYKNGEEIKLGVPVSIKYAGNVFVPLRPIVEALGCDVQWNEDLQRVDITTK